LDSLVSTFATADRLALAVRTKQISAAELAKRRRPAQGGPMTRSRKDTPSVRSTACL